jgi:transposase
MLSRYDISETDAAVAKIERRRNKSAIIRDRFLVLHLLSRGYKQEECADIAGISLNTVGNYVRLYKNHGIAALFELNYRGRVSCLEAHKDSLVSEIEGLGASNISQIRGHVKAKYGLWVNLESLRRFLHKSKIKRRKAKIVPCGNKNIEAWEQKQAEFVENTLNPMIDRALNKEEDLLFSDTAHFVQGKYDTYIWSKKPVNLPSSHGRYRVNVIGFLDISDKQVIYGQNDKYVSAQEITEQLSLLRERHYTDRQRVLNIVMDNARYQHCEAVKQVAEELNINLVFLPAYSPNLNLIERLWKEAKKMISQKFYEGKKAFYQAISDTMEYFNSPEFLAKFQTLFTTKFQVFKNTQILRR